MRIVDQDWKRQRLTTEAAKLFQTYLEMHGYKLPQESAFNMVRYIVRELEAIEELPTLTAKPEKQRRSVAVRKAQSERMKKRWQSIKGNSDH